MGDQQPAGAAHRGGDGREVHRGEGAGVDDLEVDPVGRGGLRALERERHGRPPGEQGRVGAGAHHPGLPGRELGAVIGIHIALDPVAALGLEHDHRVLALDGLAGHPVGVLRGGGGEDPQPGGVGEQRLGALGVVLDRADPAAVRDADHQRQVHPARGAVVHLRDLGGDLVVGGVDEAVELDLDHGAVAAEGQPHRGADDPGLGQRRVHHALVAELGVQPVGDAEDPAQGADVLTHQQHPLVGGHRVAQPGGDGLGDREGGGGRGAHARPSSEVAVSAEGSSSNCAMYSRYSARSASTIGWGSA